MSYFKDCPSRHMPFPGARRFFCAHPRIETRNQLVTPEVCRICRFAGESVGSDAREVPEQWRPLQPLYIGNGSRRVELVVARHNENVDWAELIRGASVRIYHKGKIGAADVLPNVGREAHTYLHHIVDRYDDLADVTVFLQGHPFDHVPDLFPKMRQIDDCDGYRSLCDMVLSEDCHGYPHQPNLPVDDGYGFLFGEQAPLHVLFHPAACFAVSQQMIQQRPKQFYERALAYSEDEPLGAHVLERVWETIFAPLKLREGIVTASDYKAFSELQFLLASLHDCREERPIAVYDLGLTLEQKAWCEQWPNVVVRSLPPMDGHLARIRGMSWSQAWHKPLCIYDAPFERVLWIDADCVVLKPLDPVFQTLSDGLFVVTDKYGAENNPALYRQLLLPSGTRTHGIALNAGVVGLCKQRDAGILATWVFGIQTVAAHPDWQPLVAWYDQGVLLWALHRHGQAAAIRQDNSWNFPSGPTPSLVADAASAGHGLVAEIRRQFPGIGIVHWLGVYKLSHQLLFQLHPELINQRQRKTGDAAPSNGTARNSGSVHISPKQASG